MKIQTLVLIIAALCMLTQLAIAQEPQQFTLNGSGARAAGMGNAFTGVADDATAISWNSAGLTQLYSAEASIIARFGFGSHSIDIPDVDVDITTESNFQLNFASLAFPFSVGKLNVVGGIAYRRILDFTNKVEGKIEGETFFNSDVNGGIDAISPSIGVQLNDMISAGATVNIYTGSTTETEVDLFGEEIESSFNHSGVGIDLGVLVKPSPTFQIGANLNLPQTITNTSDENEDYKENIKIPLFFSIGAAIRASDNLTIAADFRSRNWSSAKIEEEYNGETDEYDLSDQNANSFHIGLEYLAQAGKSIVPLRAGFYTVPTPGTDAKDDQITFSALTAGLGVILGNIIIDGSFEYLFGSYVLLQDPDIGDIEYSISEFKISIGGTVHFGKN